MRKFFTITIALSILSAFGWGYMTWQNFLSDTEILKDKDEREYALMRKKFSGFSFKDGFKIYDHLKSTSKAEFVEMRFRELRDKWYEDKDFRKAEQTKESEERKRLKNEKAQEYELTSSGLQPLEGKYRIKALSIRWASAPPWQKTLLLREKCDKYLALEKQNAGKRRNIHNLPTIVTLTGGSGNNQLSIPSLCEKIIPDGASEQELEKSLEALREQMNYYFFVDLLREAGIPKDTLYPPDDYRLKRMATDFVGYN